ncbi:MAG: gfo/Idh/MocA family oxidoreductase, partial [Opitutaceae bacterium]|nr:gfo/Idh/MocA family oxidoreductase [Opitutaceae bacterium]
GASSHGETVHCEKATLRYAVGGAAEVRWADGRLEKTALDPFDALHENHLDYFRYLRGESARPATTLADSRPFVTLNDLAYISSGRIAPIPATLVTPVREEREQKDYLGVAGIAAAQENFLNRGVWPGTSGWDRATGEVATRADLPRLPEVIRAMAGR